MPPQLLLAHHLKALKLPTFLREYDKQARQCAAEGVNLPRCFAPRNASATRSSAGPSYGLPGQPPNTAYRITLSGLVLLRPGGLILLRR